MLRKFTALIAAAGLLCCLVSPVFAEDVPFLTVDEFNFPNQVLREAVKKLAETYDGKYLTMKEIEGTESLTLAGAAYDEDNDTTLKGIEYFTNLKALTIIDNFDNEYFLDEADLSSNTKLEELTINYSYIDKLDLSKNTALTSIIIERNEQLASVNLGNNSKLETLTITNSRLTSIDLSNAVNLTSLDLSANYSMSRIDLTNNTKLEKLNLAYCSLEYLNVSTLTELTELDATGNKLTRLSLDNNKLLTKVKLYEKGEPQYSLFLLQKHKKYSSSYCVNLSYNYISSNHFSRIVSIDARDKNGRYIETYTHTHDANFYYYEIPEQISYYYDTGLTTGSESKTKVYLPVILERQTLEILFEEDERFSEPSLTFTAGVQDEAYLHTSARILPRWRLSYFPPGLLLNVVTGRIHGTPVRAGEFTVNVTLQDKGYSATEDENGNIVESDTRKVIEELTIYVKPKITTSNATPLIEVTQGKTGTATIKADGGSGIKAWKISSLTDEDNYQSYVKSTNVAYDTDENDGVGITINDSGKVAITTTGNTAPGIYEFSVMASAVTEAAEEDYKNYEDYEERLEALTDKVTYTVRVLAKDKTKPVIDNTPLMPGTIRTVYGYEEKEGTSTVLKAAIKKEMYEEEPFVWTVTGLPKGLYLKAAETYGVYDEGKGETSTTAEIAGTPVRAGTFNVKVIVSTVYGTSDTKTFTLKIDGDGTNDDTLPEIIMPSDEDMIFYIGKKKELAIQTDNTDDKETLKCTLAWKGPKIQGLTLDNKKCLITGVPASAAGDYVVNATVTNKNKKSNTIALTITLKDKNPDLVQGVENSALAITDAVTGSAYKYTFKTLKDTGNAKWTAWTCTLTDKDGNNANFEDFNLEFTPASLTLATPKKGKVAFTGSAYAGDYILTITPDGDEASGEYNFTIRILNKAAAITTKSLKNASIGSKYSANIAAKEKVTWTIDGLYTDEECEIKAEGDDAPNFVLSSQKAAKTNKIISVGGNGKAAAVKGKAGKYYVRITAEGNNGATDEKILMITINPVKPKLSGNTPSATIGKEYNAVIRTNETGEDIIWNHQWVNSKPGSWLEIIEEGNTLTLSGTPGEGEGGEEDEDDDEEAAAKVGTYKLKVTAENSKGTASKTYSIKVTDVKPDMSKAKLDMTTAAIDNGDYEGTVSGIKGTNLSVKISWAKNAKGSGKGKAMLTDTGTEFNDDGELEITGDIADNIRAGKYYLKVAISNSAKKNVSKTFTITLKDEDAEQARTKAEGEAGEVEESPVVNDEVRTKSGSDGLIFTTRSSPEKFKVGDFVPGNDKYIIVAVFDAIEVDDNEDYEGELGPVTIDDIYAGKELIWLPGPSDEKEKPDLAENDAERAFFVDDEGRELDDNILPEGEGEEQIISVNTFLRKGITYEPLIVIEAE